MPTREDYRQAADDAIVVLRDLLRPFVEASYRRHYPNSWERRVGLDRLRTVPMGRGTNRGPSDPDHLLGLVIDGWREIFEPLLDDREFANRVRSLAYDLRALRADDYHHVEGFSESDAWKTADSARRLLDAFGLLDDEAASRLDEVLDVIRPSRPAAVPDLDGLRRRYLEALAVRFEFVNLGGIAPVVDSRVVRLPMDRAYVPATLHPDEVLAGTPGEFSTDTVNAALAKVRARIPLPETDVLAKPRALIVGGPGSGKSTLVRHAARTLALAANAGEGARTPIVVAAPTAAEHMSRHQAWSLLEYIAAGHTPEFGAVIREDVLSGRAAVFVDGLDEVPDPGARAKFGQAVDGFAGDHPGVTVTVTTRHVGYRDTPLGAGFMAYHMRALNLAQIESFLRALYECVEAGSDSAAISAQVDRLMKDVAASPGVRELAGIPLLLTIIALLGRQGGRLPERRVELLEIATQTLLRQWPLQHGFGLDEYDLRSILEPVAARVVSDGGKTLLHRSELRRLLASVLIEVRGEWGSRREPPPRLC